MANILEFLRGVLTDGEAQRLFLADPEGFVERSGFGDLTGEDVVEAIVVLRRSLSADLATALADFEDERNLPAVRPSFDERDVDAAVRQLHHAVDLARSAGPSPWQAPAHEPEPAPSTNLFEPAPHDEPIAVEAEPAMVQPATWAPEPAHHEPIAVEPEPALTASEPEPAPEPAPDREPEPEPTVVPQREPEPDREPESVFGTSPPAAPPAPAAAPTPHPGGSELRARLASLADDIVGQLAEAIEDAERYADEVRADAERAARDLRAEAEADREEARRVLLDAREEATRIREEAAVGSAELESRRATLREAERELRERLAGLDNVFRSVLKDD